MDRKAASAKKPGQEKRASSYGMLGAAFGLGFVLGPAFGGLLGGINPRLPFWVAAGLTLVNAMYGLFVLPENRGEGIGRRLIRDCLAEARRRGCGRMEWMVLDWNAPAIGFYRRLGARHMKEWLLYRIEI